MGVSCGQSEMGSAEPARYKRDEREAKQAVERKRERRGEGVCGGWGEGREGVGGGVRLQ